MKKHQFSFIRRAIGAIFHGMDPRAWKPAIGGDSKACVKNIISNAVTVGAVLATTFAMHARWPTGLASRITCSTMKAAFAKA